MIHRFVVRLRRLRRFFSKAEWSARLLSLTPLHGNKPGLIMIQIDGLARSQLESAMHSGRMPFLEHLIHKQAYRVRSFYSGLPSSTPAVQAELFYGVRCAVPAFGFQDRQTGQLCSMLNTKCALPIQAVLEQAGAGLLTGGSAYSNTYTGGADKANFCVTSIGLSSVFKRTGPFRLLFAYLLHSFAILRALMLLVIEFVLAFVDVFRGIIERENLFKEIQFIPSRVGICVLLREFITAGASIDAARGLPIIHCNFLGYDEQSHRRGPSSKFAHWTLKGIDNSIRRIWKAARHSAYREYDIWIYSDHGQEKSLPFESAFGMTLESAVTNVLKKLGIRELSSSLPPGGGMQLRLASFPGSKFLQRFIKHRFLPSQEVSIAIPAVGPVGHLYLPETLQPEILEQIAENLVTDAHVPIAMLSDGPERAIAWTRHGRFLLPDQVASVVGSNHPFLEEVGHDLVRLIHHHNAGDLVLSGWRTDGPPISFAIENGAHGGPGSEETRGFALLPIDAPLAIENKSYIRPLDLRAAALHFLHRQHYASISVRTSQPAMSNVIRIVSYNVHSCIGLDGNHKPGRLARVIAACNPDIVALQELDVNRKRTESIDQASWIARKLGMQAHFFPSIEIGSEQFGNAVLSRFPLRVVKAHILPGLSTHEPRGALWVEIDAGFRSIQLINTHLGLRNTERLLQVEALMSDFWVGHPLCKRPVVLCGDFNMLSTSMPYRALLKRMRDAHAEALIPAERHTYMGMIRIDYVFISPGIRSLQVTVPGTELVRLASDHLPLIADLELL